MKIPRPMLIAVGVAPLVALFALLAWGVFRNDANPGSLAVFNNMGEVTIGSQPMPPFTLELYNGSQFSSESLGGKVVMIDFWASWCPPCRAEAAGLETVWQEYEDRGDVAFVGVAIWDRDADALKFLQQSQASYSIGKDPKGNLAVEFGVTGIPEKYFIGPQGQVLRKFVGPIDEGRLRSVLDDVLNR
ncbi:MAG: Redoxin domain protein [Dehalococcoidia bacterium]|nr:Redoxin domain protein [Dehalococcoidia bacterium]